MGVKLTLLILEFSLNKIKVLKVSFKSNIQIMKLRVNKGKSI